MDRFDICIVGAGVVGLAIAARLGRMLGDSAQILLLEQELDFGGHASSRNSEVIHAGIYYPPDSLKARFCVRGRQLLYEHCERLNVAFRKTGKLIVAPAEELPALERLYRNAVSCGVDDLRWLDRGQLRSLEPRLRAEAALLSPSTGILDSHGLMLSLLHQAQNDGVLYAPRSRFQQAIPDSRGFLVNTAHAPGQSFSFHSRILINSAGLEAVRVAGAIEGVRPSSLPRMHYCKGDYFSYRRRSPFAHLVYPVPASAAGGLGIHGTLDLDGRLRFGPDAQYIDTPRYEVQPDKALSFSRAIARYFPAIAVDDLQPAYAGVRPRLSRQGFSDFLIQDEAQHGVNGLLQLFGIESPGLTASLAIAEEIGGRISILRDSRRGRSG